ncbi:MAG: SEC-C domain-containing protein [Deltaproteobacteria bacterium]|nr:SEC-C domain-containing protein [Deltaproteobacteria bacterium]
MESLLDVDQLGARLDERLAPAFEKKEILAALGALGGPRAEQLLAGYLVDPDPGLEHLAMMALVQARAASPEGAGYSRNSPCPCGSGAKWKHCCAGEQTAWSRERRTIRADLNELWR